MLVVAHGGPGLSDHTELFAGLCPVLKLCPSVERVVFYDQLGCGASDKPMLPALYTLQGYVDELQQVVSWAAAGGGGGRKVILLGHSWGGQVVLDFLLSRLDADLAALCGGIVSSAPLNEASYEAKQRRVRNAQDAEVRAFLEAEECGKISDGSCGALVYGTLVGQSEADITGTMAGWSALPRLAALTVRTLLLCGGEFDTVPHEEYIALAAHEAVGGLLSVRVLPGAGHAAFFEPEWRTLYFESVEGFIRKCLE